MHPRVTIAREIAYDAFAQVMQRKTNPDEATEKLIKAAPKPVKRIDRNFIKENLYGSLRWFSKIYWIIQNTSSRDLDSTSPEVRSALIMGTYQIFYMDRVPDRAAVNESVEYIKKKGQHNAVKFVNGILRSIARRAEYFAKPDKDKKPREYLSLQFAHPDWIVDRWFSRFNFERLRDLLAANNQPPHMSVRVNTLKTSLEDMQSLRSELLRKEKVHSERTALRCCLKLRETPDFDNESLFSMGYFSIQDEASQLIGYLVNPQKGDTIVDACCGPGGKISHIYELASGDITLHGVEKSPKKLAKVQDNFKRLGHKEAHWHTKDFLEFKLDSQADRILLDAPCSGLGVLRRHPEGKWHKKPTIVHEMAKIQKKLIEHAISLLKVGGELIFSVCSFEEEETIGQLEWIRQKFADKIEVVDPADRLPDYYRKLITKEKCLLIFSGNKDGMDGFGSFIIRKVEET